MHDNKRKGAAAFLQGLMLVPLLLSTALFAAEPAEPLTVRIESVDVPAQEIRADGVDYSLSGRATVTLQHGGRLSLRDLQPGMNVRLGLAKVEGSLLDSVVVLPD
jgi:hypothetical protein